MGAPGTGPPPDLQAVRDGRDLENGRDLEEQPLVHVTYDPNSRWHRLKKAVMEPPKATVSIYADIPFNHAEWKRHRNAAWRHRPQPVLFMRVAGGFWWQLTYTFVVSILVGVYHHNTGTSSSAASKIAVPFNLTTFALSLLLVFRTNSSYSRWWEARTVWGAVVNLSRNFGRQSMLWLPPEQARIAVRWMMTAPYLLKCHLRFNASVRENVSHILLPQELDWVLGWTHRPNAAAHVLATAVSRGGLDTNREQILMELVNTFIDCVGKCERIFKTPIPAAYTRHTSRYLMIYLTACPLVLWPSLSWWTPITAVLITFLLLGTENIGVQLEEPFRVLPLDDMCRGIEATLREIERQHGRMGSQYASWCADPAGLPRSSSESSLDSFQDGPADGPSEPAALERFHHIPAPPPLAAAAHALRLSLARGGAGGGGGGAALEGALAGAASGSGELSHHQQPHPHVHHLLHHGYHGHISEEQAAALGRRGSGRMLGGILGALHLAGASTGGGGGSAGASPAAASALAGGAAGRDIEEERLLRRADSSSGGGAGGTGSRNSPAAANTTVVHWPHHVHHAHRRLPQHPADVLPAQRGHSLTGGGRQPHSPPLQEVAAAGQVGGTLGRSTSGGRHSPGGGEAVPHSASPFARPSQQAGSPDGTGGSGGGAAH